MNVDDLAAMPGRVARLINAIADDALRVRPAEGEFAIVEHLCHLRDIEHEGYAKRIEQLLSEDDPFLRDLDGDALAIQRRYIEQDAYGAVRAFAEARAKTVAMLEKADDEQLARDGMFENVGRVTLAMVVAKMRDHDQDHLRALSSLAAAAHFESHRSRYLEELTALCRIPGISASDPAAVRRSADAVARLLESHGIGDVRILEAGRAHPAVYGSVVSDPGAPTVLIYGHHDVQPPGAIDRWHTPPFEPAVRDGRLYARGAADDKGGVMAHVAAAASYVASSGAPPCNLKFFIEGEEEIGSPNLAAFLDRYRDLLAADAVVLADTPNYDTGVPALTFRLRGMCVIDVEVCCLERPLHSGRGAGAVPDPIAILCSVIASLGVDGIPASAESFAIPFDDERFAREMGLAVGVALIGDQQDTWTKPAITVIGFDAPAVETSFNQIAGSARARLSVRTVPPLDSARTGETIAANVAALKTPHARVSARVVKSVPWWRTEPSGLAFDAARRALQRGYGREPLLIGAGGSIGFVGAFAAAFAGTPLLLMGVEDPPCNAHSENESLDLGDWGKCARSSIFLYDELARALAATPAL